MCDTGPGKGTHEDPCLSVLAAGERDPVTVRRKGAQFLVEARVKDREWRAITRHRQRPDIRRTGSSRPREGEHIACAGPAGGSDGVRALEEQRIATPIDVDQPKR